MESPADTNLLISFYGDDFTGSTDAMEALTLAGVRTALFTATPDAATLGRYPGLRGIGVAGVTRSLPADTMEAELRPAFTSLKALNAPITHYKVCSTFDSSPTVGSIGRAIDVGRAIFPDAPFVPLLVAAPSLGRYCIFGNLFATFGTDGEVFRLDRHPSMSRHPITPADESDLRIHLARQTTMPIALSGIVGGPLPDAAIVLFDALYAEDIERVGKRIAGLSTRERPMFVVGSSGVSEGLGMHWRTAGVTRELAPFPHPGNAQPLLVVSGSCSPVTERQIEWALSHGFADVPLETVALADESRAEAALRQATERALAHLAAGRHVVVHTARGASDPRVAATPVGAKQLGEALAAVVRAAAARANMRRVLIAGGDTSGYLARALGIESLEMIAPLVRGAPLCRARAAAGAPADGLELNFKGGQVGAADYFGAVARGSLFGGDRQDVA